MKSIVKIITNRPLKGADQVKRVESKKYENPRFENTFTSEDRAFQLSDFDRPLEV